MLARLGYVLGWVGNTVAALFLFLCGAIFTVASATIEYVAVSETPLSVTPIGAATSPPWPEADGASSGKRFLVTAPDGRQYRVTGAETNEQAKSTVQEWRDVGPDLYQKRQQAIASARERIARSKALGGMWLGGFLLVSAIISYGAGRALRYIFAGPGPGAWWN